MEKIPAPVEKACEQCQEVKPIGEFYRTKNGRDGYMKICIACHKGNLQRSREAQQAEYERLRRECEKREQEEREERELAQQRQQRARLLKIGNPDGIITQVPCSQCGQPVDLFYQPSQEALPWIRCDTCNEARLAEQHIRVQAWIAEEKENPRPRKERQAYCVVCGARKGHSNFPWGLDGHSFARSWGSEGMTLYISCYDCIDTLASMPLAQQRRYIQLGCKRAYGDYQAVYKLTDPETKQIRYIGRTNNLKDRYNRHLKDISDHPHYHYVSSYTDGVHTREIDTTRPPTYTRSNWMYDLSRKGLKPIMSVLYEPSPAPLVVEWEQRYILYGLQQGWPLTNMECDRYDVQKLKESAIDFLHDPFEKLLKEAIFQENRFEAFVHKWYDPLQS